MDDNPSVASVRLTLKPLEVLSFADDTSRLAPPPHIARIMNIAARLSIGSLARKAACSVPTIRYYEDIGLIPAAQRTAAGQRAFDGDAVDRLVFIRRCRDFGFSIEQIRELVQGIDQPERPCSEMRDAVAGHLGRVREKLIELRALERTLAAFVRDCETTCVGGESLQCTIVEDLRSPEVLEVRAVRRRLA